MNDYEITYKEIMDYVFEISENMSVIIGYADITRRDGYSSLYFKDLTKDSFWVVLGNGDSESILQNLLHWECDVELDGEYEFKAILKYYSGDYSVGESGFWEISHIEFKLVQTIIERERNSKLDYLFDDIDKLFDI